MTVPKMGRLLSFLLLWIIYLVNFLSLTHGQVDCIPEVQEQCDKDFYCDDDYRCKKCAECENFGLINSSSSCAKSLEECGMCLDGYEFHSPGRCVARYPLSLFFFWVGAGSSSIILLLVVITAAFYYTRKRHKTYWTRGGPEGGLVDSTAVVISASAPLHTPALPPYTTSPPPPFNPHYTGSSEPLLKSSTFMQDFEMDGQQMANPYSNCVRLPSDINMYNFEETGQNLNGHVDVEDNVSDAAADFFTNNEMPLHRRASGQGAPSPAVSAEVAAEADPIRDIARLSLTTQVQDCITNVESIERSHDSDSDSAPRPTSPAPDVAGSQHLIVQFINNISPVLNLQGNNTRR